jgi:methionyl-tRNA formyltransferase
VLGHDGLFTRAALARLLAAGARVAGLVVWAGRPEAPGLRALAPPGRSLAVRGSASAVALAWQHGLDVLEIGRLDDARGLLAVRAQDADVLLSACFPRRLPPAWLALPRRGSLNLHPSLLPAHRGPAPLFWQLREGAEALGVSIHLMDEGLDTGPLVAQAQVVPPDDADADALDALLAARGAELVLEALAASEISARPQPADGASRDPWPSGRDLVVPVAWSARRAFRFVRGAKGYGPFTIETGGARLQVRDAVAYAAGTRAGAAFERRAGLLCVAFADGSVELVEERARA